MQDENAIPEGPLMTTESEMCTIQLTERGSMPSQHSCSGAASAGIVPRSPAQPHTPNLGSPQCKQACMNQPSVCPASGRPASMEDSSPVRRGRQTPTTPLHEPSAAQLWEYKRMCHDLEERNAAFEASCAELAEENGRLKARQHANAGVADPSSDAMADQLAQQLQIVMQEKARLQRDKEQLEQDNGHLLQMLDYARAMMDDGGAGASASPAPLVEDNASATAP